MHKNQITSLLFFALCSATQADTTSCIFDWAEASAPTILASSSDVKTTEYGNFSLRYYDESENALVLHKDSKELFFYDASEFLAGREELPIYSSQQEIPVSFKLRQYLDSETTPATSVSVYLNGDLIGSFDSPRAVASNNYPQWATFEPFVVTFPTDFSLSDATVQFNSTGGLTEVSEVMIGDISLAPSESNLDLMFGTSSNLYWVGNEGLTEFLSTPNLTFKSIGQREYWAAASKCNSQGSPFPVQPSSYLETHLNTKKPIKLPDLSSDGLQPHTWELADFQQAGKNSLVLNTLASSAFNLSKYNDDPTGEIYFFSREDEADEWVDITNLLLDDNTGCILPRKTLVADFNNDSKPDVVFACHGLDFGYSELKEKGYERGEANRILLSQPDGKYTNNILQFDGYFENCFCHGGAAGDIDNDGNVDLLLSDTTAGEFVDGVFQQFDKQIGNAFILLGDGNGNFTLRNDLPESFKQACCYYSLDLFDFDGDGYLDIWASGGAPHGTKEERNIISYSDEGAFLEENIIDLPTDGKHTFSVDMLFHDNNVYLAGINIDFSKSNYYFGYAITKIPLDGSSFEVLYEHEDYYTHSCPPTTISSWIEWLLIDDGHLVAKQDCDGRNIRIPL